MDQKKTVGNQGEKLAITHLEQNGYEILDKNYRAGHGEIDIIARIGSILVFVEVKTKKFGDFGDPVTWVTRSKQRQIGKIAQAYILQKQITNMDYRFDVIALTWDSGSWKIDHIENAFWL